MQKHHLEFMQYLRPVLKEEVFDAEEEGWGFLATHVIQNNQMFHDILAERQRQQALINDRNEQNKLMKQKLLEEMKRQ